MALPKTTARSDEISSVSFSDISYSTETDPLQLEEEEAPAAAPAAAPAPAPAQAPALSRDEIFDSAASLFLAAK